MWLRCWPWRSGWRMSFTGTSGSRNARWKAGAIVWTSLSRPTVRGRHCPPNVRCSLRAKCRKRRYSSPRGRTGAASQPVRRMCWRLPAGWQNRRAIRVSEQIDLERVKSPCANPSRLFHSQNMRGWRPISKRCPTLSGRGQISTRILQTA